MIAEHFSDSILILNRLLTQKDEQLEKDSAIIGDSITRAKKSHERRVTALRPIIEHSEDTLAKAALSEIDSCDAIHAADSAALINEHERRVLAENKQQNTQAALDTCQKTSQAIE